jgi:ribosomal protein S18
MKWTNDEIDFMSAALEQGWTHKDIANELDINTCAVKTKASVLKLSSRNKQRKSMEEYAAQLPEDIKVLEYYINNKTKIMHKHICGFEWKAYPNNILRGHSCPKCYDNSKITEDYIEQLPEDIILLGKYINSYTKILHKHSCGFEWETTPNTILMGHSCPECNKGFNIKLPAATYLIYFSEYDLYKFGISNNYKKRLHTFGSKPEIIFVREFELGSEALTLEKQWSNNVDYLKINTGQLKSGNTETFKYKAP